MPPGTTLGDIDEISWWAYTVAGYPAHVDIVLDLDGDWIFDGGKKDMVTGASLPGNDDVLVAEFAYQPYTGSGSYAYASPGVPYGHYAPAWQSNFYYPKYDAWVQTFQNSSTEQKTMKIDDNTILWLYSGLPGPYSGSPGGFFGSLVDFKNGVVQEIGASTFAPVNSTVGVLWLEIEIDNWLGRAECYIDDVSINGNLHPLDEKHTTVGTTLTVSGSGVTSGSTVDVYWDIVKPWDGTSGLVNTTSGNPDGSWEVDVTVPDASASALHYIWVDDQVSGPPARADVALRITPKIKLSPTSGIIDDTITITGSGFGSKSNNKITLYFDGAVISTSPTTVEADSLGSWTATFNVPSLSDGLYTLEAKDTVYFNASTTFTVGPRITLDKDQGPTGTVVEIDGVGFATSTNLKNISIDSILCVNLTGGVITTDTDGAFTTSIIIPNVSNKGDYAIRVLDTSGKNTTADFNIDGLASIVADPTYGAPGATIVVRGYNFTQLANTDVEVTLNYSATVYVTAQTDSEGTFEDVFQAPAIPFANYKLNAVDEYGVNDITGFKVGLIAMIINPTSGPSGTEVTLTGIGFANGAFNMSFGDDDDYLTGTVVAEAIAQDFFVPTIEPGVYEVSVTDSNENVLTTTFTVTDTTTLTPTPANVAVGYNVSFYGDNYSEDVGASIDWYAYNSTWEDSITVIYEGADVEVTEDGNFTGYWVATEDLLLGNSYFINATDGNELYAETLITIVEEEIDIRPNSLSYSLGEVITFTIKATFAKENAELEIWDPDGYLIFMSVFEPADWELADTWQVVRYWDQVNEVGNPFLIPNDAQIGTWNWNLTDVVEDEVIASGEIEILPTTAEQVDQRLSAVEGSLADLADDIVGVTTELEDDIGDLAGDLADVASEVEDLRDEIVSDLADDIAAAADAADAATAAVEDLEGAVSDIADVANEAASAADAAASAAGDAATAAEEAKTAATGLTTLVYGAIGASLIAALAAIVSLMQISRKIA
jgi:hypothetical protein